MTSMTTSSRLAKCVLVTAGTRGIGRGLVEHLSALGRPVAFTFRTSADAAREIERDALARGNAPCEAVPCDGSDPTQVEAAIGNLVKRRGPPFALINNMKVVIAFVG